MKWETKRDAFRRYVWDLALGDPYVWGYEGSDWWDCSGLVSEGLQAVGILRHGDRLTAELLFQKFKDHRPTVTRHGCLAFWPGEGGKMKHVEIIIWVEPVLPFQRFTLGASGGGRNTTSPELAREQGAFVKMRPLREKSVLILDPFLGA